ncbi:PRC-barrel domain-containing protein [Enemella evansiae]|uniref:PRC-barrel domain-containing protein n=1 Tax=Enemella evansiae TaxID=2016499 RepID=A0A255GR64_9ACTN|nr:PRC-barrel domain-containing protein [Enemella evansiae]OYO09332.1 hypothetical protein BI335_18525 [Enemella evansiae]OYO17902.1 hypothetical protein CGZ94_03310 [Enemella evansiae]TDO89958.1 PRC-barrel domain protein [Enemella evansiae]
MTRTVRVRLEREDAVTDQPNRTQDQPQPVPDQPVSGRTADDDTLFEAISRATVRDRDGNKLGKVGQLFLDDRSGRPSWVTVKTGLFGTSETFVPLQGSSFDNDELTVDRTKDVVSDAPRIDPEGHLDPADEDALYDYYGLDSASTRDASDPQNEVTPAAEQNTYGAEFNNTAGLTETRPAAADRDVDPVGGLNSPTVDAAADIPPVRPRLRRHR